MAVAYAKRPLSLSAFALYPESESCTGIEGLDNLLRLFRKDVKIILTKLDIAEPSNKWKDLQSLIEPYRREWTAFSASDSCPLPEEQLEVIEYCRKYDDLSLLAKDKGYSYSFLSETLKTVIKRLTYANFISDYFAKWKEHKHVHIDNAQSFLNAPLQVLKKKISNRLYYMLELYGKNMAEILQKATLEKLRNLRGFGIEKEKELKNLLREYGCHKMLK